MKKSLICTAIAVACCSATSYAEVFTLGQIDVVENGADISTVSVNQDQLRQNQISNVAQVAKMSPGVSFERGGARGEQNIRVRGFNALRVPVFIDGIPVYVPYDGNMDLGRFTTFDLAEINISKGASSVLYGANTMGGAVNLVTRKPTKALEGVIGYGYQTGRNSHTAVNQPYFSLGTKQEKFYAQVSGSFVERQGVQLSRDFQATKYENGGRADNSSSRDRKLSLRVGYTPNATDEYAISYSNQDARKQQPFYTGNGTPRFWRWPAWDKESLYFLSHTAFADGQYYLNTKLFHDTFNNDLSVYDDETFSTQDKNSSFNSHYRDYSYGAGLEFGANTSENNTLKLSALYKFDVHREHNDGEPVARNEDRTYSVGLEDTYRFTDTTKAIVGVSYDYKDAVKAQNYQALYKVNKKSVYGIYHFDTSSQHAFNYQAKVVHNFTQNDELSISYAHKSHLPTMKERYSRSLSKNRLPNPFLKPEIADHIEIGYFHTFNDMFKVEGALFYSHVKDAINEVAINDATAEVQNQNVDKAIYKGVELGVTAFVTKDFTLGANYTYTKAKNGDSSIKVTDLPRHKFFAYADWKVTPELSIYLSQTAESGRYALVNKKYETLSGFGTTDAKISYTFKQGLSLDVGVSNIFDKNYYLTDGYAEEGRVYFANVKYSF
ncbi:TonB-dependent receptor plug domain-containing protein [Lonepinella sp. BR2919]|uniref:TonB-dependent receptor plug domain-containing protein n=1 Tax=unclassified Lonepinella TaxID=2642006 RepID=UPI003F6E26B7